MRQALRNLSQSMQMVCVGEATSGSGLLDKIISPPDLFLLDLDMPYQTTSIEVIKKLKIYYPSLKITTFSYQVKKSLLIKDLTEESVRGYILKEEPYTKIKEAIKSVAAGKEYYSQKIIKAMLEAMQQRHKGTKLSLREIQVLLLVSKTNHEIGRQLGISVNTVATHIKRIKCKLGIPNREELIKFASQNFAKLAALVHPSLITNYEIN